MAKVQKTSSVKWREVGNRDYKKAFAEGIAPTVKKGRIQDALKSYNKAMIEATGDGDELASAAKNYAKAAWLMASHIEEHEKDLKQFVFYYKDALSHFSKASCIGMTAKTLDWTQSLLTSYRACLTDAVDSCSESTYRNRVSVIESFTHVMQDENFITDCYENMAKVLFHQAVSALEKEDYKTSLYALKESYRPIELMKMHGKGDSYVISEASILEQDVMLHMASAESLQAIVTGDELLENVLMEEENLNMDMVYTVIDMYKHAIVQTREIEVEREAIANSRLGKLYDQVLKIRSKAREYFGQSMQLAHSLTPRVFTSEPWFRVAADTLQKYQEESVQYQESQREKERQKHLDELKDEIKILNDAVAKFDGDDAGLLLQIYEKFPLKNPANKPPPEAELKKMDKKGLKKVYQKAVLHYHPDKQDVEKYGKKWEVLCDCITKRLTNVYERYKIVD